MTQPQAETEALASGLKRTEIEALLEDAEPMRMSALAASLNLAAGAALTILGSILSGGSILYVFVAAIAAGAIWQVSNRLWRDQAIAALAPVIGEPWGQSGFAGGWAAVDIETRIREIFDNEGARFAAWQSHGRYREISYRLQEATIWRRRRHTMPREVVHLMQVEIEVPRSFTGRIELVPQSGFMGKIDDVLRQLSGDTGRRQAVEPAFDAVFETNVEGAAPVADLLTPNFRRAMLALAARYPRMYLTGRFEHGCFSLRLPINQLVFASAGLLKPMPDMIEDADSLWWDLTVPHRLIDGLTGDHDGPLR
ncbi:MAG: hypothetical protein ABS75_11285 [Pelagibacterium sp. SCN 63-23]|nr:MAG: hypothetical protein ABS75_11285 [Pelagibacterium sp. SCN 63-23]